MRARLSPEVSPLDRAAVRPGRAVPRSRAAVLLPLLFCLQSSRQVASGAPTDQQILEQSRLLKSVAGLIDKGNISDAYPILAKLIKAEDLLVRLEASFLLGRVMVKGNHQEDALKLWEKALGEAQGTAWWARLKVAMGGQYKDKGETDKALLAFEEVLTKEPHGEVALDAAIATGDVRVKQKDYPQAVRAYEWAINFARTEFSASPDLGSLNKKLEEARKHLRVEQSGEDTSLFEEAERLRGQKQWPDARAKYEEFCRRFPESPKAPPATWAIGDCLLGERKVDNAIAWWQSFIQDDRKGPWRGPAYVSVGDALLEFRFDFRSGKEAYETAQRLYDDGASSVAGWSDAAYAIHQRMGVAAYIQNQDEKALKWFESSAAHNPPRPFVVAAGHVPSGVESLVVKLRNREKITPPLVRQGDPNATLLILLGDIHYEADDYKKSRDLHERILVARSLHPSREQRAWSLYQLGRMHNWNFEFEPAIQKYLEVADKHTGVPWGDRALLLAGIAFYSTDKPDEALKCYERILREYPQSADTDRAAYYIGLVYEWTHRYKQAKAAYDRFLQTYPDSAYCGAIRRRHLPVVEISLKGQPQSADAIPLKPPAREK